MSRSVADGDVEEGDFVGWDVRETTTPITQMRFGMAPPATERVRTSTGSRPSTVPVPQVQRPATTPRYQNVTQRRSQTQTSLPPGLKLDGSVIPPFNPTIGGDTSQVNSIPGQNPVTPPPPNTNVNHTEVMSDVIV